MPILRFQSPAFLAALAVVPPLWLMWRRACLRTDAARRALSDGNGQALPQRRADSVRGALRIAALGAVLVGLAGPGLFPDAALSSTSGVRRTPLVFVLDVSASMAATDVEPDRIAAAREAVSRISTVLPAGRTGLVAVAEDAAVACPPTPDRGAFLDILGQIRTNWMGVGGTRLSEGLSQAHALIARDTGAGVIVLVSDGEDHGEPLQPLLERMRREGTTTHTVTVGSSDGAALKAPPAAVPSAEPIVTRARPDQMAAWAAAGGGRAWSVTPAGDALPARPDEVVSRRTLIAAAQNTREAVRLSPWLYLLAAGLLLADWLVRAEP